MVSPRAANHAPQPAIGAANGSYEGLHGIDGGQEHLWPQYRSARGTQTLAGTSDQAVVQAGWATRVRELSGAADE